MKTKKVKGESLFDYKPFRGFVLVYLIFGLVMSLTLYLGYNYLDTPVLHILSFIFLIIALPNMVFTFAFNCVALGFAPERNKNIKAGFAIIASVLLFVGVGVFEILGYEDESGSYEQTYDIFDCDAPFGRYWTHSYGEISGGGNLIYFHIDGSSDSELQASYTVQYLQVGVLFTKILNVQDKDVHVVLLNNNDTMHLRIVTSYYDESWYGHKDGRVEITDVDWWVYIPNPKLYEVRK